MAKKDYDALARFVLENVGGKENVVSLRHCVTRLRFKLKDEGKANTKALQDYQWVIDVIQKGGQYQVVIGNDVEDAYDAVMKFAGLSDAAPEENGKSEGNLFDKLVDLISNIFVPILPLLAGSGVIKGIVSFAAAIGWISVDSGTYQVLFAIGNAFFYFFPLFVGFTAAEKFGLNKFIGMAVGACLVSPALSTLQGGDALFTLFEGTPIATNVTTTLFGIPLLLVTYTSSVMPTIAACYLGSKVEKFFKGIVPDVVRMFLVPSLTLVVTVVATLLVVGPVVTWLSQLVATGIMSVRSISPVVTGMLVGGFWQVLVVFGLHHAFTPIQLNNLATQGFENVIDCMQCVPFTTMAVVLAVYLRTHDKRLKAMALPAAISSFFGVSEPSIYGVTLPLKRPFFFTLICASIGGGIMGFFNVALYTQPGGGLFAIPAYINPDGSPLDMTFYGLLIALAVSMALGFVLTFFFGVPRDATVPSKADANPDTGSDEQVKQEVFTAPVSGAVVPLEAVDDEVFASGSIGRGVAVKPSEGEIVAPADGEVTMLFKTGHAVGITTTSGAELLIHIGIDTVQLNGRGFKPLVKAGDTVKRGQQLVVFDRKFLAAEGYDDTVIFLVSNPASFQDVIRSQDVTAATDRELLAVLA